MKRTSGFYSDEETKHEAEKEKELECLKTDAIKTIERLLQGIISGGILLDSIDIHTDVHASHGYYLGKSFGMMQIKYRIKSKKEGEPLYGFSRKMKKLIIL